MTTIVAVPGALYSDSNVVDGTSVFKAQKIYLIRGKLVGCAGDNPMIHFFLDAFRRGVKRVRMSIEQRAGIAEGDRDFSALIVDDQGIWHYDDAFTADLVQEPFMAIGSGGDAARGSLLQQTELIKAGSLDRLRPEQAVEIACQIDSGSRGPVQMLKLKGEA